MRSLPSLLFLAAAIQGHAATYHVSTTGNDSGTGLSIGQAFRTIQHAADVAQAGDSVVVHAGHYTGFAAMDHGGTANAPIVFHAEDAVVIDVPCTYNDVDGINVENVGWVVVEGFEVVAMPRAGIRSALSDHVTLRRNTCTDNGRWGIFTGFAENVLIEENACSGSVDEHGIYVSNSADHPIVRYNDLFDNHANGLHMNGDASQGDDGVISDAQVYGNVIHGNGTAGGSGINCDGVVNSVIHDNLLFDNHASGISLYVIDGGAPSTGNKVFNNTIVNAADSRWCVNITSGCTGNQVLNNILINEHPWHGSITIASDAWDGFVSDHNLVMDSFSPDDDNTLTFAQWQALGQDAHSHIAASLNTLFTNPSGGDFHTASATAQQVDAGTNAVAAVTVQDMEGTPRPQGAGYDAGCYEYDGSVGVQDARGSMVLPAYCSGGSVYLRDGQAGDLLVLSDASGRLLDRRVLGGTPGCIPAPDGIFLLTLVRRSGTSSTITLVNAR